MISTCRNNFKLTVSKTLWLFAFRPFHCSALRQSLEVHPCPEKYRQGGDTRPVVVLFGWLLAKSRHLHKYGELYHQYGADVITVKLEVMEILRPKKAEQVATEVLNKLISDENKHRPVVIHGFSVGGYLYSHVLNLMVKQDRFSSVKERIRGQVLDSPVDFHGIPYGVSNAASENPLVRWLMKSSIEAYLAIFARYTTKVYLAHSHLFHNNPVRSPALFFFSKDDKVADVDTCQACADYWKNELNMTVSQQCFESSPHVSHFYVHNKEYTEAVKKFLRDLNIPVVTL